MPPTCFPRLHNTAYFGAHSTAVAPDVNGVRATSGPPPPPLTRIIRTSDLTAVCCSALKKRDYAASQVEIDLEIDSKLMPTSLSEL